MIYKLFANCIRCEGFSRAIIYDLHRNTYHLIPKSLYGLFTGDDLLHINYSAYPTEQSAILREYLDFLLQNELVFAIDDDEISLFPKMSTKWDYPSLISNVIIDVRETLPDWTNLKDQVEELKCYFIQIRFFKQMELDYLKRMLSIFFDSMISGIEILTPYNDATDTNDYVALTEANPKLKSIIIYNSQENKVISHLNEGFNGIFYITDPILSHKNCGVINPSYFTINIDTYTESQQYNTCLNRKLSIDENGEIKNCPSMPTSYGNIKNTRLVDVAKNADFQKLWSIKKDQISKCKDCEFRHICTDCRAYVENPGDVYSPPLKCGYDPYNGTWEDWSVNPLKERTMIHYGLI